jgi:hypothetical protein
VASKLDPFKAEIHRLLGEDASMSGQRIRELIVPLGFDGGKTIVDDYLREVRRRPTAPVRGTVARRADDLQMHRRASRRRSTVADR